ncbi:MAG TPA: serine hydrolase [Terriglobales bacterium]|nr:serine hydrolase [Terriglobales bacterium]
MTARPNSLLRRCLPALLLLAGCLPAHTQERLQTVDAILQRAVEEGEVPGAVLEVGHDGRVVYRKAFGARALEPRREEMTVDTIFDLASMTKPVATAMCVMRLVELGQVRLNEPVAHYLPQFGQNGKQDITVRQLLTHFSGLPPDLDLKQRWAGKQEGLRRAYAAAPVIPPGSAFSYSDINFIVLGALVEKVSGMPLEQYAERYIFQPLGMNETRFLPPANWRPRIAPTQFVDGVMLRGVVHDPTARRMGGVAGHAGLFSTADDLAKFAQALLDEKILTPGILRKMETPQQPPNATVLRGLGWDIDSPYSTNRGELLPVGSFGHTGFTGTSIWIDPVTRTYIILLTNAVHPNGGKSAVSLRSRVATAVTEALDLTVSEQEALRWAAITGYNETETAARRLPARNGHTLAGIDVLEARGFDLFKGGGQHKIGLLTNQTGVDAEGRRTIDVLAHAPGLELAAIFSPEHGATGTLDTDKVGNSRDASTGVPVYSVYGAGDAAKRPSAELLRGLDAVLIDLQDAGARFYTYETTVGYFLEAAAQAGTEVIVLDRPNPITGAMVQGPLSVMGKEPLFTNYFPMPVRHGMTPGELAQMFNGERRIGARLRVIAMQNWMRGDWYDSAGMAWINPSPNLRSLTEATLYPGVALVEGTNVSVGRGTDTPFELVGAPWIKGRDLAAYLNGRRIPGVRFVAVSFTPASGPYSGQVCQGVNILLLDRAALDAPEMGIELAAALRRLYPLDYKIERMAEILANPAVFQAVQAGEDPRRIAGDWQDAVQDFQTMRAKYLIYPK